MEALFALIASWRRGLVPRPQWKMNNLNFGWFKGDTVNIGVGQGYISATPIQLAHYTAVLANKGTKKPLFLNNSLSGKYHHPRLN